MDTTQAVLAALVAVLAAVSTAFGYVLWRVAFENPGIIKASLAGGVAAPPPRMGKDDDDDGGASAVDLKATAATTTTATAGALPGVDGTSASPVGGAGGNAVIAVGAGGGDKGLPEKKAGKANRRGSHGEGGGVNAGAGGGADAALAAAAAAAADRLPDWEIDYRKLRFKYVIGKGNFGEVWLAAWLGSPVAVKTIVPELQNKEKLVKRFQDEIMLMSTLHHPNVVLFLGACTRKPNLCLVIEYCVHGSLHHFLKNEATHGVRISMSLVLRFALDIARGVYYLHRRCSVVQRDLKARNILVDESLNAKVADFGLSRVLDEGEQNKLTACGTPAWTAPEIVKMEAYTDKVDVYSFGIIMWEIITREEPYGGQKGVQIAYAAAEQGLRPEVPSFCPSDYAELMRQCWADDPAERPTFATILKKLFQMKKACDAEASKALGDPTAKPFFLQPLPRYTPSNAGGAMIETRFGPKAVVARAMPSEMRKSRSRSPGHRDRDSRQAGTGAGGAGDGPQQQQQLGERRTSRRVSAAAATQSAPSSSPVPSRAPSMSPRATSTSTSRHDEEGKVQAITEEGEAGGAGEEAGVQRSARSAAGGGPQEHAVAPDSARPALHHTVSSPATVQSDGQGHSRRHRAGVAHEGHGGTAGASAQAQAHVDRGIIRVQSQGNMMGEWDGDVEEEDSEDEGGAGAGGPGHRHSRSSSKGAGHRLPGRVDSHPPQSSPAAGHVFIPVVIHEDTGRGAEEGSAVGPL